MARPIDLVAGKLSDEQFAVLVTVRDVATCRIADIQRAFDDAGLGLPQHDVSELHRIGYLTTTDAAQTIIALTESGEAAVARHERQLEEADTRQDDDELANEEAEDAHTTDAVTTPANTPPANVPPARASAAAPARPQAARQPDQRRAVSSQPARTGPQQPSNRGTNAQVSVHSGLSPARTTRKAVAAPHTGKQAKAGKPKPKPR